MSCFSYETVYRSVISPQQALSGDRLHRGALNGTGIGGGYPLYEAHHLRRRQGATSVIGPLMPVPQNLPERARFLASADQILWHGLHVRFKYPSPSVPSRASLIGCPRRQ